MSVLIKALEKAAEERDKMPADAKATAQELVLEAMDRPSAARAPNRGANAAGGARSSAQANAAAALGAYRAPKTSSLVWMETHPLYVFGGLAAVFLMLYGVYVYVQIAHPSWLIRTPPPAVVSPVAPASARPATTLNPARRGNEEAPPAASSPVDAAPTVPMPSVFGGTPEKAAAAPAKDASREAPRASSPPPPQSVPMTPSEQRAKPPAQPATPSPGAAERAPAPQQRVTVNRGDNAAPRVDPAVSEAYAALDSGRLDTAQRLYGQVLRNDPANIDALLGLAAIAQKEGRAEDAQRYYMTILQSDPRHALAQSGLVALMGRADPQASESRLKQLLAREPSAPLYFNLGNLYADQGMWAQAQQAYFQAHTLEPGNADYAYNLAVGLDHLGQQKIALGFYRKAQQLASVRGVANFDIARIQDRITQLSARFE